MATETVVPHHTCTTDEPVENKMKEEEKPMEQDTVSPPKKNEEEENPKAEGSSCATTTLSKLVVEAENKKIEPPVVEVQKTDDTPVVDVPVEDNVAVDKEVEEQPVADSVKSQPKEQPTMESVAKEVEVQLVMGSLEKVQEEQPKIIDVPKSSLEDVPVEDKVAVGKEVEEQPVADSVQPKEPPTMESVAKEVEEHPLPVMESVEKVQEELPKIIDVPKSSVEAIEKPGEPAEVLPVKESEEVVVKDIEDPKLVSTETEKSEPLIPEVEVKSEGKSEIAENFGILPSEVETKFEEAKPMESMEGGIVKDEEPLAVKVEDTTFLKEEESSAITSSEQVVSTNQQAQADPKEDGGKTSVPDVAEKVGPEEEKKKSDAADVVGKLPKEATFENEKAGEENVITEESTLPNKVEDVKSSNCCAKVTEKSFEVENSGKDVEHVVENISQESVKDEKPDCIETNKDVLIEGKVIEGSTPINEPVKGSQQSKMEGKDEESEKEKIDETAKSEVPSLEPFTKDGDDTKTSQDLPKEIPAKPTQKQSNTILSKVKQSLVKAKKAIIGKSQSQTKGDIKVK